MSPNCEGAPSVTVLRGGLILGSGDPQDLVVIGDRVVSVGQEWSPPGGTAVQEIDLDGAWLMPAFVDAHCHPLGGGGGEGPEFANRPLLFEDFTLAGVAVAVGCLGHDTSVRVPEALLHRVRALTRLGLRGFAMTGEISDPPVTLTGSITRDLALIPEIRAVKASLGESTSIRDVDRLLEICADAARGARTAGQPVAVHLHVGADTRWVPIVRGALDRGLDAGWLTLTHINWNEEVLAAGIELASAGVNVDVTACIRPEYFAGALDPAVALVALLTSVAAERVTITSDAGGSHRADGQLVDHQPDLLLRTWRDVVAKGSVSPTLLAQVFALNPASRLGLTPGGPWPGARADLVALKDGLGPHDLVVGGRVVVRGAEALMTDPVGPQRRKDTTG